MLIRTIVKVALRSLTANKLRTFLAMLGIIIGVGSVVSMLALGAGAQRQVMERITAMGTNLLFVRPGSDFRMGVRGGATTTLVLDDARAAVREVAGVEAVAPTVSGRAQAKYYGKNTNVSVQGVTRTYAEIRNFELERGRNFTGAEEDTTARVAILGAATAEELFGAQDPVGENVRIKASNFRIIGVLKKKGDQGFFNPDEMILVPIQTAMKQLFGQDYLSDLTVKVPDGGDMSQVEVELTALLRKRHRIRPGADDDFFVRNQAELLETANSMTQTFTALLGGIAGISLLVGGIGIMNIMLVTVTERTREIGVRKAIGARNRDILRQFLLESVLLSVLGGAAGIGLGVGIATLITRFGGFVTVVESQSVMLSVAVSVTVGVFFGFYPATRAARLHPIEALRYE